MLPTTRKDAKKLNLTYYDTGVPCKKGHHSKRFAHSGNCYECSLKSVRGWYSKNKTDIEWRKQRLFKCLKSRSVSKGIPFNLEYSDIIWPSHCPIFNSVLEYDTMNKPKNNSASFDKVIPELGYVKGNVRIISYRANWLKQDSTIEQLEKIIRYMKEHQSEHFLPLK